MSLTHAGSRDVLQANSRRSRAFADAVEAAGVIDRCRQILMGILADAARVQDLLIVILCWKILFEFQHPRKTWPLANAKRANDENFNIGLDTTYRWLAKVTRESWETTTLSPTVSRQIVELLRGFSILRTAAEPGKSGVLSMLFTATSDSAILEPDSSFARSQTKSRLIDAGAFKVRSTRLRAITVAACKALGALGELKTRNLDYMRGNHKQGIAVLNNFPKLIHVELATACNIRCRTCSITRPGRARDRTFIKFETLERLRPALPFITDCKLHGGGEPFLHPQIEQVLAVFRDEGVRLNTVTNANLIVGSLGKLIGDTFSTLTVSVDGVDQETYEYVRVRGKWDKLLRGLDVINEHRKPQLKLIIGVVMLKCNIHQLPDLVRFAKEHNAQELQAAWLVPFHDLPWTHTQGLADDPERTNHFMAEARKVGAELGVSVRIPLDLPIGPKEEIVRLHHKDTYYDLHGTTAVEGHCRLMYDRCMILVDGRVKPCGQSRTVHELGSVLARSFEACWNSAGYQRLRTTFNSGTLPRTCMSCNFIRSNQTGTARLVYRANAETQ